MEKNVKIEKIRWRNDEERHNTLEYRKYHFAASQDTRLVCSSSDFFIISARLRCYFSVKNVCTMIMKMIKEAQFLCQIFKFVFI